jgi:flavin-dependent dehydrogenase
VRVAIIGGGAAGSFLAYLLTQNQVRCVVYESRTDREKPCGGGCTPKVTRRYGILASAALPKNLVYDLSFDSSRKRGIALRLRDPLWIYSRRELDTFLLDEALRQGAGLIRERATGFQRQSAVWQVVDTKGNRERYDFLVGADGAGSLVRKTLGRSFAPNDLSLARGYYLPGQHHGRMAHIRFADPDLPGYLWAFPRCDHVAVGALSAGRQTPAATLDLLLKRFVKDLYGIGSTDRLEGYAAPIPTLRARTLLSQQTGGRDWALIGDAAGFVDPLTAEGIAYALRSAELLSSRLAAGRPEDYSQAVRKDFGRQLLQAALLRDVFYRRKLGGKSFIDRMLSLTKRSDQVRELQNDYVAGSLGYAGLFGRLLWKAPRILSQALATE